MIYELYNVDDIARFVKPNKWKGFIVHHTEKPDGSGNKDERDLVKRIDLLHKFGWKYKDGRIRMPWINGLGYHIVIGRTGRLFVGKRWIEQISGAHCPGKNKDHIGIGLLGNFEIEEPIPEQFDRVVALMLSIHRFGIVSWNKLYAHRIYRATSCPGKNIDAQWFVDVLNKVKQKL